MVYQTFLEWQGPGSSPKISVLNWQDEARAAGSAPHVRTFLTAYAAWMSDDYGVTLNPVGRELNTVTGALEGVFEVASVGAQIVGTINDQPVPDTSQVLVQWRTDNVVSGRFLRGRTFLPGCAVTYVQNGNLADSTATPIQTAANALIAAAEGPSVWSRTHGIAFAASTATVWREFGVLRGRRG